MKKTISINKNTRLAYIPSDIIKEGFKGDVEIIFNFNTAVMLRPGSVVEDQLESLESLITDIKARERARQRETKQLVSNGVIWQKKHRRGTKCIWSQRRRS